MPVLVFLFSAIASNFLLWPLIPQLRRRLLDHPTGRSSHQLPTPRGGGIVFVLFPALASTLAIFNGIPAVATIVFPFLSLPLSIVGFLDDIYDLSVRFRYVIQLATAFMIILVSPLPLPWVAVPLLLIAVTAVINFTNFTDGLDGLVAGCMAVIFVALGKELATPWPFWALVGSLIGFLFWNWSPAKIFMGDVGSTFLGAVFAALVLQAHSWSEAFAFLLVATPLMADAFVCVVRRWLAGQRIFNAHRLHLFQRLYQAGWSHPRVSTTYIVATAVLAIALLAGGLPWVFSLAVAELLVGVWLEHRVAVPFAVSSES